MVLVWNSLIVKDRAKPAERTGRRVGRTRRPIRSAPAHGPAHQCHSLPVTRQ